MHALEKRARIGLQLAGRHLQHLRRPVVHIGDHAAAIGSQSGAVHQAGHPSGDVLQQGKLLGQAFASIPLGGDVLHHAELGLWIAGHRGAAHAGAKPAHPPIGMQPAEIDLSLVASGARLPPGRVVIGMNIAAQLRAQQRLLWRQTRHLVQARRPAHQLIVFGVGPVAHAGQLLDHMVQLEALLQRAVRGLQRLLRLLARKLGIGLARDLQRKRQHQGLRFGVDSSAMHPHPSPLAAALAQRVDLRGLAQGVDESLALLLAGPKTELDRGAPDHRFARQTRLTQPGIVDRNQPPVAQMAHADRKRRGQKDRLEGQGRRRCASPVARRHRSRWGLVGVRWFGKHRQIGGNRRDAARCRAPIVKQLGFSKR